MGVSAQTDSVFWFAVPHATNLHHGGFSGTPTFSAVTSFGGLPAYLRIACTGPTTVTISVPANTWTATNTSGFVPIVKTTSKDTLFSIDMGNFIRASVRCNPKGTGPFLDDTVSFTKFNNGVKIVATGSLVTAYWDNANTNNRDIFSLKGGRALGTDFFIPMQNHWYNHNYTPDTTRNGFTIVATAPGNTTVTIYPSKQLANGTKKTNAGDSIKVTLTQGQTYRVVALKQDSANHIGGTRVHATQNIAITDEDDSTEPLNNGYDYLGDQLVPINIIGDNYIVTSGHLVATAAKNGSYAGRNLEWYYITATQNGTVVSVTNGGGSTIAYPLNAGQQQDIRPPAYTSATPYSIVSSTKPVYVYQTTGFVDEPGAALIPKIDGCTGSQVVYFASPSSPDSLYLNIMAYGSAKDSLFLTYTYKNKLYQYHLNNANFIAVGSTGWYVYNTQKNSFTPLSTPTPPTLNSFGNPQIPYGVACKVYTTIDRFHLGVIAGSTAGAKYGYFSNFSEERGSAQARKGASITKSAVQACFGDTVILVVSGGSTYQWTANVTDPITKVSTPLTNLYMSDPTVSNPSVFPPPGLYQYSVKVSRQCWGDTTMTISVYISPKPVANFNIDNSFKCTPTTTDPIVNFTNTSFGANDYKWWFTNNPSTGVPNLETSSINPIAQTYSANTGTSPQKYTIQLSVYNTQYPQCIAVIQKNLTILPRIVASFSKTATTGCSPLFDKFTNFSTGNTADTLFRWTFGNGNYSISKDTVSQTFQNNYFTGDTAYNVKLLAISPFNCRDSITQAVTVHPFVQANFVVDSTKGCSDLHVTVTNKSNGKATLSYSWNFGDGFTSTLNNPPVHVYTNTGASTQIYNLALTVSDPAALGSCSSTYTIPITVYPKVAASFTQDSLKGCDSLNVHFINTSVTNAAVTYNWDFGDGTSYSSSTIGSVSHQYIHTSSTDVTYTVRLTTLSSNLCQANATSTVTAYAMVKAAFAVDKSNGCSGFTSNIINTSQGGIINYLWNFGDGTGNSSLASPVSHIYSSVTSQNFTLSLNVNNSHGYCKSYYSVPITVNPGAAANFSVNSTGGCNPLTVNFTNTTDLSKTNKIRWEFGDGTSDSIYSPSHIYTNINSTDQTYNVKLIAWSNSTGCIDTTIKTITTYAYIQAAFLVSNTNICSNVPITFTNTSLGGITSSLWNFGDGHTSNLNSPVYSIKNTDTIPKNYNVKLLVQNSHACSKSDSAIVTVNPAILSSFKADNYAGCQPFTINLINLSNIKNASTTTFNWNFGDGVGSTDLNPSHTYTNNTGSDITFPVKLTTVSSYSCTDDTTINFTVYSYVSTDFNFSKSVVCAQELVTIFNNSSPGVTLSKWDFNNDGNSETTINNKSFDTLFNNTKNDTLNYNVKLIGSNVHGCNATTIKTITVNPTAIASFIVKSPTNSIACQPHTVLFKNTSNIAGFSGTTSAWNFADGGTSSAGDTVTHIFFNPSSKDTINNVQLTVFTKSQYGTCSNAANLPITTYAYVKAGFSVPNNLICSGNTISFINSSSFVGTSNASSFINKWDYLGNGTYSTNNLFNFSTTYNIPSTSVAPISYTVKLKASDGNSHCFDSITHSVTIAPKVIAQFQPSPIAVCDSQNVKFTNNTYLVSQNVSGVKSYWDFGDGTSNYTTNSSSFNHLYTNSSTTDVSFPVKLTVVSPFNNCTDDTIINIPVYARTQADFNFTRSGICSDDSLQINNYSIENSSTYTNYWSYGDGNTDNQKASVFSHFYINHTITPTTTNVRLIVQNSHSLCRDTLTRIATIYPKVVVDFAPHDTAGCQPLFVPQFLNKTNLVNVAGTQFNWDFGDSTNSNIANPSHQYINTGATSLTYNVKLSVLSKYGCTGFFTSTATAYSYVGADFKLLNASTCSDFPISIMDNSSSGVTTRNWDFDGNGSTDSLNAKNTFNHIYYNTTNNLNNYNLTLIAKNNQGCSSTTKKVVTIYPKVTAGFTAASGCTPLQASIANTTNTVGTQFNWYFGDGSTSSVFNPVKTFYNYTPNDTNIAIKLVAYSDYLCSDSITKTIQLYHRPVAEIGVDRYIGCPPFTPVFQNNSITSGSTFTWDFGDHNPGSTLVTGDKTITHTYYTNASNILSFKVVLDAITPHRCDDTTSVMVNVYPLVTAKFDTVQRNCSPIEVLLNNKSTNAKYYLWNFGDSTTSNQMEPRKVFYNFNAGNRTFAIKLVANSEYNCTDSSVYNLVVFPTPVTNFTVDTSLRYYPNATFYFTNLTNPGPWVYDWNFKDGKHSSSNVDLSHTYTPWGKHKAWGIYNVVLTAKNGACIDSTSQNVILDPPTPVASFIPLKSGCAPVWGYFNDSASMWADYYLWDFGDSTTSKSKYAYHTYYQPGIYNVKLTVTGDGGSASHYETVNVYAKPVVDFDVQPTLVMIPDANIKCYNQSQNDSARLWYFGDGTTDTSKNPLHKYDKIGDYLVTLTAITSHGCTDSSKNPIDVKVSAQGAILFPNAFTPNTNGTSDGHYTQLTNIIFHPYYEGVADYHLEIYDRWGELLFTSNDVTIGWDGYFKNRLCSQDVYVYKAWGRYYNGKTFEKAGDLTLLIRYNK